LSSLGDPKRIGPQLRGPIRERRFGWGSDCSRALTNRLASSRPRIPDEAAVLYY
jgi:hypothetical protein